MKLSTGRVAITIDFDNGDKDAIYFNPSDPELLLRMQKFEGKAKERIKAFEDVELTNEGTPADITQIEAFEKMQNILKEELDWVFDSPISKVVFKHCSPFAIIDGEFFVIQFVNAIAPEIKRHIEKAKKASNEKMLKHIGKYQ